MKWMVLTAGLFAVSLSAPAAESQNGRYQIVINPNARADTFLLDTVTGKVWSRWKFTDPNPFIVGDFYVWALEERVDGQRQLHEFIHKNMPKKGPTDPDKP